MYEGRTRGKRLRYTFSDEEDFDSDAGTRRSTRTSGRETPAVPAGPTVTASGRQVRSRATGMYGESLLSGQVSDRASPATGDYVRSDVSEEPQQPHAHGRATRAAGRGATNGRLNRTLDSEDDDDATSWDGGDEDEDEPEGMILDDEEDEGDDGSSSEDETEPNSLMVTLRYTKGSFDASNNPTINPTINGDSSRTIPEPNGARDHLHPGVAPLAGHGEPRHPAQPIPTPSQPQAQPPPPIAPAVPQVSNGTAPSSQPFQVVAASAATPMPHANPVTMPQPEALFPVANHSQAYQAPPHNVQYPAVQPLVSAQAQQHHQPLPSMAQLPYQPSVPSQVSPQPQPQAQQPVVPTTLPPQTSATNWQ